MFTGIVQSKSIVLSREVRGSCVAVALEKPQSWKLSIGQSVAIDGICSTVIKHASKTFEVEYMPETLSKTTASAFESRRVVNLERSLRYGEYLDGHIMQGHVDTVARVNGVTEKGSSQEIEIQVPATFSRSISLHGSIAINGVSLTVARKSRSKIVVALIPHTLKHTNLGGLSAGDFVNIELDHSVRFLKRRVHDRVARYAKTRTRKK